MDKQRYREKILGGWLGKAVGGTLGQPWEGCNGPLKLTFYQPVPETMIANDDLDVQVVWACKLSQEWNGRISRHLMAGAWPTCVNNPCDEYGVAIRNFKLGLHAPYTGRYDNFFTDGMGAAIRSEIWAALAPGEPEKAARFAYEDACVDHDGNGIYAEQFLAALESMAFVVSDIPAMISRALELIPADSLLAAAIRDTAAWCRNCDDPETIRLQIMKHYGSSNFTDVKMDLSFIVAALLLGRGDFSRTITTAVNFGADADCTGATAGAFMGIVNPEGIDERWLAPIGRSLVLSEGLSGFNPPDTLDGLTDLIVELRDRVYLDENAAAESVPPDPREVAIPMKRWIFSPWFPNDFRKFRVELNHAPEEITVPGNLIDIDFSTLPVNSLLILETEFELPEAMKTLIVVNTPAKSIVWVDGVNRFGRDGGVMVPAFHRTPINQRCELDLDAGKHQLRIGLAPINAEMKSTQLLFGVGGTDYHWLANAFSRRAVKPNRIAATE